jgi:hypothetical protein
MTKNHATNQRPDPSSLPLRELQALFADVLGATTRCPNRIFLERKIRERWAEEDTAAMAVAETVTTTANTASDGSTDEVLPNVSAIVGPSEPVAAPPEPPPAEAPATDRAARTDDGRRAPRGRFSSMTIEELQAKYVEVVGRATSSENKAYLVWKIREAEKGRITVGPRRQRSTTESAADAKVLPLRLEADLVAAMDQAWRAAGMASRMQFLRLAIGQCLRQMGAREAAASFGCAG